MCLELNELLNATYDKKVKNIKYFFLGQTCIGVQNWSTTNLDVQAFRNGDTISEAQSVEQWKIAGDEGKPAWCFYDNNQENGEKYGKLYNWFAVNDPRGLTPEGWHVPSNEEWDNLTDILGGVEIAGLKMKITSGWEDDINGTDESGFTGLPSGCRFSSSSFVGLGKFAGWWSSSETDDASSSSYFITSKDSKLNKQELDKFMGLPVRCLRD